MTNEDIKNSTTLIGPSCVGKSLLANELSKKLNMNYVCIDDLLVMIGYEQSGNLSQNKKVQQKFIRQCAEEIINDPSSAVYLRNPRYRKKQIELIKDFVKLYNYYANMFGGLHHFYDIYNGHMDRLYNNISTIDNLENLKVVTAEIVATIINIVDGPLIFDVPASIGWETKNIDDKLDLKFGTVARSGIDVKLINQFLGSFLNDTTTVLLVPGMDYEKRNGAKNSEENNLLLKEFENYYDFADISITTNGLFNNPTDKHVQRRSWLNPKEALVKEKLKNKGEIANICDEIILRMEELKAVESLQE